MVNVAKTVSMCLSVHVKDWLSFPLNQMYVLGAIRSKESKIPKYLECTLMNLLCGATVQIEAITKKITAGISALKRLRDFASRDVYLFQFIML